MTAVDAYRHLIDWQRIDDLGVDVLHCFSEMASGDYALTFFGKALASDFLNLSEDELLGLSPGTKVKGVTLWQQPKALPGFPEQLWRAYEESNFLQPRSLNSTDFLELLRGGNLDVEENIDAVDDKHSDDWKFTISSKFRQACKDLQSLQGGILKAALKICENPLLVHGNTMKPLTGKDWRGCWRYRFGHYRLVYYRDEKRRIVRLLDVGPRGGIYD